VNWHTLRMDRRKMYVMKLKIWLVLICLVSVPLFVTANNGVNEKHSKVVGNEENYFVLKMARKYVGADVQIYKNNGELIGRQKLINRKITIDFSEVKAGIYVIRVSKDNTTEEFTYVKK
jgi:hypothetical protein